MNYVKILVVIFIFFISSEIFFNNINNTPRLVGYYLQLSKYDPSLLQNAIKVRLERNSEIYSEFHYEKDSHKLDSQELEIYSKDDTKYLENELPLILYNIALSRFESGNDKNFTELLEKSILVDPDLSFSYVELANYYFYKNEEEKGQSLLERCLSRMHPKAHCSNYLKDRETHKSYLSVGFLKSDISKYFEDLNKWHKYLFGR